MNELWRLTAHDASERLRAREFSAVELTLLGMGYALTPGAGVAAAQRVLAHEPEA